MPVQAATTFRLGEPDTLLPRNAGEEVKIGEIVNFMNFTLEKRGVR
jgi:hypothetical protein